MAGGRSPYDGGVFGILAILFLVVPIVEIYLIILVGSALGVVQTVGLLILISVVGAWLVRREGLGILARLQASLADGQIPTNEIIDGLLVLFGGALMLTPGFFTDGVGLLLLFPPTRVVVRTILKHRFRDRIQVGGGPLGGPMGGARFGPAMWTDVTDVTETNIGEATYGDDPPPIEFGPSSDG